METRKVPTLPLPAVASPRLSAGYRISSGHGRREPLLQSALRAVGAASNQRHHLARPRPSRPLLLPGPPWPQPGALRWAWLGASSK